MAFIVFNIVKFIDSLINGCCFTVYEITLQTTFHIKALHCFPKHKD